MARPSRENNPFSRNSLPIPRCELQGYDYEFEPPLDKKFECSICLLCQRDPIQTSCGHRFCRECITHWLRYRESKCPEDNFPITEQDVFSDNFAKREILSLKVKCLYFKEGCTVITELSSIEAHVKSCNYITLPCPNNCSQTFLKKDLPNHIKFLCLRRLIKCNQCYQEFPCEDSEVHSTICPVSPVICPCCRETITRNELCSHLANDCPRAIISCIFLELGCSEKVERGHMLMHLQSSNIRHMRLLCKSVTRLQHRMNTYRTNLSQSSHTPSPISTPLTSFSEDINLPSAASTTIREQIKLEKLHLNDNIEEGRDQLFPTLNVSKSFTSIPTQEFNNSSKFPQFFDNFSKSDKSASSESRILYLEQKNVYLEQKSREAELKLEQLEHHLALSKQVITDLTEKVTAMDTHYCNGVYLWRIKIFLLLKHQAENGINKMIHSPGFYTSSFGYKLCLRININQTSAPYISLFIHFMKGDYDDYLDWPFSGRITLMIIDQNDQTDLRQNIVETLIAKPSLAAFHRPATDRNPKGFGYMEFVPLNVLENGTYIRQDTLVIKATVVVTQG